MRDLSKRLDRLERSGEPDLQEIEIWCESEATGAMELVSVQRMNQPLDDNPDPTGRTPPETGEPFPGTLARVVRIT